MSAVLVISPEPWSAPFVSKHHYAIELARQGRDVLFLGPPEGSAPMSVESVTVQGVALRVVRGGRVARGLRRYPSWLRRALEARWLRRLERLVGTAIDVVWLFENSRFFDMRFAGRRVRIYQQVDLDQDYHPRAAARTADLVVTVSAPITNLLTPWSPRILQVNHGCRPGDGDFTGPSGRLRGRGGDGEAVHALLAGNLDSFYLDVELLLDVIRDHPAVRFHLVGPCRSDSPLRVGAEAVPNVTLWGLLPAAHLPPLYRDADVLLVIHRAGQYGRQRANSHKIMEYLASGRVIVATRTSDYDDAPHLVRQADDPASYRALFTETVAHLDRWNAPEQVRVRQAFAQDNTYARQIERILDALPPGRRREAGL